MSELKKIIKQKFDFDVTGIGEYVNEQSKEINVKLVTDAVTMGYVGIQTGIKYAERIKILNQELNYQTASCEMTASGDSVLSDRLLTVADIGFMQKWCPSDLAGTWGELELKAGAMAEGENLPFEKAITEHILELNAEGVEQMLWKGDTTLVGGNLSFMDGFIKLLTVANGAIDTNTAGLTAITASNAFDAFVAAYNAMPRKVRRNKGFVQFTGDGNFQALLKNMNDLNYFNDRTSMPNENELKHPLFGTVVNVPGLDEDDDFDGGIYSGVRNDFRVGTDLESDFDTFALWYSKDDDVIKNRVKFRLGVQVPFMNQIGVFRPVVEGDPVVEGGGGE